MKKVTLLLSSIAAFFYMAQAGNGTSRSKGHPAASTVRKTSSSTHSNTAPQEFRIANIILGTNAQAALVALAQNSTYAGTTLYGN